MTNPKFSIGSTVAGEPVTVDLDRLVESRMLVTANSGGGKSWLLRRILEQTHGRIQHLVLDVEGDFHTLREKYDYVLVAKRGGDCVADARIAELLVRRLLELGVSAVCDLYELKHDERELFVQRFLEALIEAPQALRHPVLVLIDEAHKFCAQDNSAVSTGAVIDLMSRGRRRGLCGVLATQRLAKLHKDAAAEANVKLIGRTSLDIDMKRAGDALGFNSREYSKLQQLPDGGFFAFGPGLSTTVVQVQVGPVETTHPRPGQRAAPAPPPREKVRKVLEQLADIPREAEAEKKSADDMRAELVKLRRELAAKPVPKAPPATRVEVPVLSDAEAKRLSKAADVLLAAGDRLAKQADSLGQFTHRLRELSAEARASGNEVLDAVRYRIETNQAVPDLATRPLASRFVKKVAIERERSKIAIVGSSSGTNDDALSDYEQTVLNAAARLTSLGQEEMSVRHVAALAGKSPRSSTFKEAMRTLAAARLLKCSGDAVQITIDGVHAAAEYPTPVTPLELADAYRRSVLSEYEVKVFDALVAAEDWVGIEHVAERASVSAGSSTFKESLRTLSQLGLIQLERGGKRARRSEKFRSL